MSFLPSLTRRFRTFSCIASSSSSTSLATKSSQYVYKQPTIYAPATGRSKQAISILRITGPDVLVVWDRMTRSPSSKIKGKSSEIVEGKKEVEAGKLAGVRGKGRRMPEERKAILRRIIHPKTGEVLDEGIVIYFPASSALTAQPTLELHTHGSPALLRLLLDLLGSLSFSNSAPASSSTGSALSDGSEKVGEFRIAEPGEFTKLAYEAGKMDLCQVEGLHDLVNAESFEQMRLAGRWASGEISKTYEGIRKDLIEIISLVEALIDFGEDAEIDSNVYDTAQEKAKKLRNYLERKLEDGRRGEILRSGLELCIFGEPNVGKSSLMNWFAQRSASIVTSHAGTTRDIIQIHLDFFGFPILLADTAGLRTSTTSNSGMSLEGDGMKGKVKLDEVEVIGIERAREKASTADLKICILSLPSLFSSSSSSTSIPKPYIDPLTLSLIDSNTIILLNKSDLYPSFIKESIHEKALIDYLKSNNKNWLGMDSKEVFFTISMNDMKGLDDFTEGLKKVLKERFELSDNLEDTPIVTQVRHRRHLEECRDSLAAFTKMDSTEIVLAAEELRYALLALGRITGVVDVEEVLGEIFGGFCVGK